MNNFLVSIFGIIIVISIMSLFGRFFDIDVIYYMPFMAWIVAIFIFNMFLEKHSHNIFMKEIKIS